MRERRKGLARGQYFQSASPARFGSQSGPDVRAAVAAARLNPATPAAWAPGWRGAGPWIPGSSRLAVGQTTRAGRRLQCRHAPPRPGRVTGPPRRRSPAFPGLDRCAGHGRRL